MKGVVEGADGQQPLPEQGVREPEDPEQGEQVVLRDAELDVLPPRRSGPRLERGDRLLPEGIGLFSGGEHPPAVDPAAEVRGDGHVRRRGHDPVGELAPLPPDRGEDPPEALLGGEPVPPGNRKRLGHRDDRHLVAAIPGPGRRARRRCIPRGNRAGGRGRRNDPTPPRVRSGDDAAARPSAPRSSGRRGCPCDRRTAARSP